MCEYFENDVNEVLPHLWLGNCKAAYNSQFITKYKIRNIITLMTKGDFDIQKKIQGVNYMMIDLSDDQVCKYSDQDLLQLFIKCTDFIYNSLTHGQDILVHCKRGHHRSAAIVCGFMVKYLKITPQVAIQYINKIRPCALRRDTCMTRALFKYYLYINPNIKCQTDCKMDSNQRTFSCSCKK
jgi:protein-tyrosine phosphatase